MSFKLPQQTPGLRLPNVLMTLVVNETIICVQYGALFSEACRPCHLQPFGQTSDSAGLWEGTTLFKLEAGVCRANLKCNGFVEVKETH